MTMTRLVLPPKSPSSHLLLFLSYAGAPFFSRGLFRSVDILLPAYTGTLRRHQNSLNLIIFGKNQRHHLLDGLRPVSSLSLLLSLSPPNHHLLLRPPLKPTRIALPRCPPPRPPPRASPRSFSLTRLLLLRTLLPRSSPLAIDLLPFLLPTTPHTVKHMLLPQTHPQPYLLPLPLLHLFIPNNEQEVLRNRLSIRRELRLPPLLPRTSLPLFSSKPPSLLRPHPPQPNPLEPPTSTPDPNPTSPPPPPSLQAALPSFNPSSTEHPTTLFPLNLPPPPHLPSNPIKISKTLKMDSSNDPPSPAQRGAIRTT